MPISVQTPLVEHVPNGVTTVFPYPFCILSSDDLQVRLDGVAPTGYTISGIGDRDGGAITFSVAPTGTSLLLYREVSLDRETDYQQNGDLREEVLDADVDRAWMAIQDRAAVEARAIRAPVGELLDDLPAASSRALRSLGFDASGQPIMLTRTDDGGAALALDLANASDATKGSGMMGFGGTLNYATKTIGWADQLRGVMAAWFPGYDKTGTTDSTSAIQAAINWANTIGTHTVRITGKPRITAALTYATMLALVGVDGGNAFTNNFDAYPNRIRCGDVTGYVFDQPDVADGSGGLSLTNLCFDGRTSAGVRSTTLQGFVKSSNTSGTSSFYLRGVNCMFGNGDATTDAFELTGQVFSHFENCMFSKWHFGRFIKAGSPGILGTTQTWKKCYFTSARQVAEFTSATTDAHFEYCAIESCVTGVASVGNNVTFTGGYSENMGYDDSGTGLTTGVSDRALGFTDAPAISGKVSAVFTCRFGQMVFRDYTILNTTGGKKWFDGIGRANGTDAGGVISIENLSLAAGTVNTLFTADADTPSSRGSFEYHLTVKRGSPTVITHDDARMLTLGRVPIQFSDGNTKPIDVVAGVFSVPPLASGGFTAVPGVYPSGGAWAVGDTASKAPSALVEGTTSAWICTTAGTTSAKWDTEKFTPWSKSETVTAGNNFVIPVALVEVGTVYVFEISGTNAAATAQQFQATVRITHLASGSSAVVAEDLDTGSTSISYSHGNPITVANSNAFSMTYYGRLASVGRTHT